MTMAGEEYRRHLLEVTVRKTVSERQKSRRTRVPAPARVCKPSTIDDYLALISDDKRAALEKLRRTIKATAPRADECISYGIPAFRLDGRVLVFFAAAKLHCSFFPGAYPIEALKAELKGYCTSKGTVRFDPSEPLPATLVRKLVKARMEQAASARAQGTRRPQKGR